MGVARFSNESVPSRTAGDRCDSGQESARLRYSCLRPIFVVRPIGTFRRDQQENMGIDGASRISEINQNMNQRKVCQHPFLFGEPRDKKTGEYVGVKNPEVRLGVGDGGISFLSSSCDSASSPCSL